MSRISRPTQSAGAMSAELRPLTIGILAIITCAAFEAMAVVTAMPSVASELSGEASYGLAFSMYLTASLLGTVLAGSWCDRQGPRPALGVGMFLMILGLLAAGAAPAFWLVTVGRAISGLGGGFMIVALYVVIARAYPQHAQPVVFGWLSAAWVVPALVGPLVAGVVAENLGWRWVFLGVAPIVLAAVLIVWPKTAALSPADGAERRASSAERPAENAERPIDGAERPADNAGTGAQGASGAERPPDGAEHLTSGSGADTARPTAGGSGRQRALRGIGLAGGVFAAQWALSRLAADGSGSAFAVTAYLLLAGAGLIAVFLTLPGLLPPGTLKLAKGLPSIIATRGFVNVAFFGAEAFIPLMLVSARGFDAATAGLALSAGALGWTGGSFLQARVRFRREWLLVAGSTVLSLSLGGFALASSVEAPLWLLVAVWAFSGFAMGMTLSSTSVLVLKLSSAREQGRNSASLQISDQLGGVVGTAGAGALFALLRDPAEPGQVSVFVAIWLALCVFAAAGIVSGLRGAQANDAGPSQDPRKAMEGTVPA